MNKYTSISILFSSMLLHSLPAIAQDTVYSGGSLSLGQYVTSRPTNSYYFQMEYNGSLVTKASNSDVIRNFGQGGDFVAMQGDGNLVMYKNPGMALWNSQTQGNPGSYASILDDGDLVVFNSSNRKIWSTGPAPKGENPSKVGDVLGRDLAAPIVGLLGHLGVWDGGQVFEAGPPTSGNNAIHITGLSSFKNTPNSSGSYVPYWGVASANIPNGEIQYRGCWETYCSNPGHIYAEARLAIARRLMQIYRIGASYTATAQYTPALPDWSGGLPGRRGVYRCDTFVIDALAVSTYYNPAYIKTAAQNQWVSRFETLAHYTLRTPGYIFDQLKSYK